MVIVFLNVNGIFFFFECSDLKTAKSKVKEKLVWAEKMFPNKKFKAKYYKAKEVKNETS